MPKETIDDLIFPHWSKPIRHIFAPRTEGLEEQIARAHDGSRYWIENPTVNEIIQFMELAKDIERDLIEARQEIAELEAKISKLESHSESAASQPIPETGR
jgi:hypothetical protein